MAPRQKKSSTKSAVQNPGLPRRYRGERYRAIHGAYNSISAGISYSTIEAVATQYAIGNFQIPGLMYNNIFRDSGFASVIDKRLDNALIRPKKLIPPLDATPDEIEFKEHLESNLAVILPNSELRELLKQYYCLKTMVGTLSWKDNIPTLFALHPQWLWNHPNTGKWCYLTRDEGQQEIILDFKDVSDSVANNIFVPGTSPSEIEGDPSWIFTTQWHRGNMDAPIASLSDIWYNKKITTKRMLEALKSYSAPLEKIWTSYSQEEGAELETFLSEWRLSRDNKYVVLKKNENGTPLEDIELVSTQGLIDLDKYINLLDHCNRAFQIAILHGNLSTEVNDASGGSYAAAMTHYQQEDKLVLSDMTVLNELVTSQIFTPMAELWDPFNPPRVPQFAFDMSLSNPLEQLTAASQLFDLIQKVPQGYNFDNLLNLAGAIGIQLSEKVPQQNETKEIEEKQFVSDFATTD